MNPQKLIEKAQRSKTYLKVLNVSLSRIIPFNKPHKISITELDEDSVTTRLPYRKSNLNHIKGLHACGIATLAEFTTGINLLRKLDVKNYRIIMKDISMQYHYQGKADAEATFTVTSEWMDKNVWEPLNDSDKVDLPLEIQINDIKGNHLATGKVTWQIKDWQKVKTKL